MDLHWSCSGFSANFTMRRTSITVLVLLALFASAAYGSKKPRVSSVSATASHKKAPHPALRAAARGKTHRFSSTRPSRLRQEIKAAPAARSHRSPETALPTESLPVIEAASLTKARFTMPPPLLGSHDSLVRQNERSEADNLERIEDDDDLADRIAGGMLVPVPVSTALTVNGNLPENRRYCRPWTASFLADLSRAHAAQFHSPLLVTSAVRTVEYQKELARVNGNAAAAEGDIASPHLTGATIDIAKQGLSRKEVAWMRARLLPLEDAGKIDVEEEFQQSCFHITVYKSYVEPKPPRKPSAQASAAPALVGPRQTGNTSSKQQKSGHRKPAQAAPAKPEPEQPEPAEQQPEAPVEG